MTRIFTCAGIRCRNVNPGQNKMVRFFEKKLLDGLQHYVNIHSWMEYEEEYA